jgi:hypothetical protein
MTWKPWQLINNIKPLQPPSRVVFGEIAIYHSDLRPDLKQNITAPTGPDLLPVLFTQKRCLHKRK